MGQYFQTNGDYNIKTKGSGKIVLTPGETGRVVVDGNFVVLGSSTSVESNDLEITDRIIVLNKGEAGPGVTSTYSGIEIDRGNDEDSTQMPRASLLFDETNPGITGSTGSWIVAYRTGTTYGFSDSNIKLRRVITDPSTDGGDLILVGDASTTGVVKIPNGTTYTSQVISRVDDKVLTNKGYVDYAILNNPTFQIVSGDSRVIVADSSVANPNPGSLGYSAALGADTVGADGVSILVSGIISSQFFSDRVKIQELEFRDNEIILEDTNTNIFINTSGTGKLQTNYAIQLDTVASADVTDVTHPGTVSGSHILYSGSASTGKSGVYFATSTNRDELVSKNRALLFSMIF